MFKNDIKHMKSTLSYISNSGGDISPSEKTYICKILMGLLDRVEVLQNNQCSPESIEDMQSLFGGTE